MSFQLKATAAFLEQLKGLTQKARALIDKKLDTVKENPFHFKKLQSDRFSKLFRVRLNLDSGDCRLVYAVIEPSIIVICILKRKDNYKDLEYYLKQAEESG